MSLASSDRLSIFCGLPNVFGAIRFDWKSFFINHLNVNQIIITFFVIKDLME
jgi:hypothetical protein